MEFKVSGQLNIDDYIQFQRVSLKAIFLARKMIILFFVLVAIFTSDLFDFRKGISLRDTTTIIAIVSFCVFLLVLAIMLNSKKVYKKSFESNMTIKEKCNFLITEDKIIIDSESGNTILSKDKIHKILFDKDSVYVFVAANIARIIKKRFCKNEEEFNALVLFIKDNYNACKKHNNAVI